MRDLTGYGKSVPRTWAQIVSSINGRIDTGRKNANTTHKQLDAAEDQLRELLVESQSTLEEENGAAVMEIYEELDDDGNVICRFSFTGRDRRLLGTNRNSASKITESKDTMDQLEAILKQHGSNAAKSTPEAEPSSIPAAEAKASFSTLKPSASTTSTASTENPQSNPQGRSSSQQPSRPVNKSKTVSFAAEPEISTFTPLPPHLPELSGVPLNGTGKLRGPILHPTERILELDENDQIIGSRPLELVVPLINDENIPQSMSSIAPVVAEINLLGSDMSGSDVEDDEEFDDLSSDENDVGMTNIGAEITDELKAEMEALMRKHEEALMSVGPIGALPAYRSPTSTPLTNGTKGVNYATKAPNTEEAGPKPQSKKGVTFAKELDVSPVPASLVVQRKPSAQARAGIEPFSNSIVERGNQTIEPGSQFPSVKKPSRFKASLKASDPLDNQPMAPSEMEPTTSRPISETIVDRPMVSPSPVNSAVDEEIPFKKVSRFKASRLGQGSS